MDSPGGRFGGHQLHCQVNIEVSWEGPRLAEEAGNWVLLAQFGSEDAADMMWGDAGVLYWLIRPEDLAEQRFERPPRRRRSERRLRDSSPIRWWTRASPSSNCPSK
ncbi:DUF1963 domain-containing protein [Streptomyces sp. MT29]|nr:DUF1963 domain-containing protein [Streptomyces sp. MT29]